MSALPTNPNSSAAAAAAAIAASLAPGGNATTKRRFADPEYIAISEFLSSVEVEDQDAHHHHHNSNGANANGRGAGGDEGNQLVRAGASGQQKRARLVGAGGSAQPPAPRRAALAAGKAYQEGDSRELMVATKSRGTSICVYLIVVAISWVSLTENWVVNVCIISSSWKWSSTER